ncbi:MAG: glycosyltransferase family 4 protein [Planctomycetota bacterium]
MKINLVIEKNPFTVEASGTQAYVEGLVSSLIKRKINVSLISREIHENDQKKYKIEHIPITKNKLTSIGFMLKLMLKAPFLKLPQDSVIHSQRPDFMLPFILFFRNNPKVCTLHGIPSIGIKTRKNAIIWGIYNLIERTSLKRIDKLIAVNDSAKEYYTRKNPRLKDDIIVIPVGIDLGLFKPMDRRKMRSLYDFAQDDIIILYIGRFSQEKGLDLLLRGFSLLKTHIPNARLILLGKGPSKSALKKIIKEENISDVTFMEPVSHDKIPEVINSANLLALCSSYEGMPTVVLEALACGVPVVSTDVGDVSKVVKNGKTGELILNRDPKSVQNALLKVIERDCETYKDDCIAEAKRFSWEIISQDIIKVYNDVAKER